MHAASLRLLDHLHSSVGDVGAAPIPIARSIDKSSPMPPATGSQLQRRADSSVAGPTLLLPRQGRDEPEELKPQDTEEKSITFETKDSTDEGNDSDLGNEGGGVALETRTKASSIFKRSGPFKLFGHMLGDASTLGKKTAAGTSSRAVPPSTANDGSQEFGDLFEGVSPGSMTP